MLFLYIIFFIFIILLIIVLILIYRFPGLFLSNDYINYHSTDIVGSYEFLDDEEIEFVKTKINKIVKSHEKERNSVMSTIGTPLYLDGYSKDKYKKSKDKYNKLLNEHFSFIYPKLLNKLEYITDKKCIYRDDLSLPGFHIFKKNTWLSNGWSVASLHVDKQFEQISDNENLDMNNVFTFTIGIQLPKKCGLYIYDYTEDDMKKEYNSLFDGLKPTYLKFRSKTRYKIEYDIGKIYFHDGLHFHMISEFNSEREDRITLQGHGIWDKQNKHYIIYW